MSRKLVLDQVLPSGGGLCVVNGGVNVSTHEESLKLLTSKLLLYLAALGSDLYFTIQNTASKQPGYLHHRRNIKTGIPHLGR